MFHWVGPRGLGAERQALIGCPSNLGPSGAPAHLTSIGRSSTLGQATCLLDQNIATWNQAR